MVRDFPYPLEMLYKEMFYLAMVCRFSYADILEMEVTERIKWVDMAIRHKEAEAKSFKKSSRK